MKSYVWVMFYILQNVEQNVAIMQLTLGYFMPVHLKYTYIYIYIYLYHFIYQDQNMKYPPCTGK